MTLLSTSWDGLVDDYDERQQARQEPNKGNEMEHKMMIVKLLSESPSPSEDRADNNENDNGGVDGDHLCQTTTKPDRENDTDTDTDTETEPTGDGSFFGKPGPR